MTKRLNMDAQMEDLVLSYRGLDRASKGELLDRLEEIPHCHHKHLISLLSSVDPRKPPPRIRQPKYPAKKVRLLPALWEQAGCLSAERFKAQLPLLLPYAVVHVREWTEEASAVAVTISTRQLSRRFSRLTRLVGARSTAQSSVGKNRKCRGSPVTGAFAGTNEAVGELLAAVSEDVPDRPGNAPARRAGNVCPEATGAVPCQTVARTLLLPSDSSCTKTQQAVHKSFTQPGSNLTGNVSRCRDILSGRNKRSVMAL